MASGAGGPGGGAGGGAGGGKIPRRRCHQRSMEPYQRERQRHQGILNSVSESVKNTTPRWLQRHFNSNEDVCSFSVDSREVPQCPENREDDHLIDANEESANNHDDRNCHEPTVSNAEDSAVSKNTSAPPLPSPAAEHSRSLSQHTATNSKKPALNVGLGGSQTVCPGKTRYSGAAAIARLPQVRSTPYQVPHVRQIKAKQPSYGVTSSAAQRILKCLEEMTSPLLVGCPYPPVRKTLIPRPVSSAASQTVYSKPSLAPSGELKKTNQKIDKRHSTVYDKNMTPGRNIEQQDSTSVASGIASGEGTAGGKMSRGTTRLVATKRPEEAVPLIRQTKTKELNAPSCGATSLASRRITLQYLEKMQSPLENAKRIPSVVSSHLNSVGCPYPPVRKTLIPRPVSSAASQTVYLKPSLAPSGELKKTNQKIDKRHRTVYDKNMTPGRNIEQQDSMSVASGIATGEGTAGGKMSQGTTRLVATKRPEEAEMEVPVLPRITLPITSSSMPTFNFGSSVMTSPSLISPAPSLTNKVQMTSSNNTGSPIFRFSSPIVKSTEADVLPPSSIGFTFSVPAAKTSELSGSSSSSEPITSSSAQDITAVNSSSCKKQLDERCETPFRPAIILKEGSVLDVLKNPGFTSPKADSPAAQPTTTSPVVYTGPAISSFSSSGIGFEESLKTGSTWQCDSCLLQNKVTDHTCVACQASKLPPLDTAKQTASGTSFGSKFKPALVTWDCDTCLVQNKPEAIRCVACETPKPGTGVKRVLTLPGASESAVTVAASPSSCTVTTGLGFGDKFKRPVGSWACPVCCVSNNAEDHKCVSCMSEKPGFGTSSSSSNPAAPSFKFGISSSPSGPSETLTNTGNFKFGDQGSFKIAMSSDSGSLNPMSEGFKFSKPTGDFKFGVSSDSKPEEGTGQPAPPGCTSAAISYATPRMGHSQGSCQPTPLGLVANPFVATSFPVGQSPQPMEIDMSASLSLRSSIMTASNFSSGSGSRPDPNNGTGCPAAPGNLVAAATYVTSTMGHGQGSSLTTTSGFGANPFGATSFPSVPHPQAMSTRMTASGSLPTLLTTANITSGSGSGPAPKTGTKRRAPPSPPGAAAVAHATPTIGHGQLSGQSTPLGFGGIGFAATPFSAGPQPQPMQIDTPATGSLPSGMSPATNFLPGSGSGPTPTTRTKRRAPPSLPGAAAAADATPTIGHGQVSGQSTPLGFGGIGFAATPFSAGPQPQPMQIDTPATGGLPSGMSPASNFLPGSGSGPTPATRTKRRTSRGLRGAAAAAAATPTIGHGQVSGHPTTPGFGGNAFAATVFSAGPPTQTMQTDTLASGSLPSGMSLATNFPSGSGSGPSSNTGTKRRAPPCPPGAAAVAHATPTIGHGQVSGQSTPLGFGGIGFTATPFSAGPQPQPMQIDTPATGSLPSGMSPATNFLPGSGSGPTPTTRTKRRTSRGLRGAAAAAATPTIGHGQVSGHPTTPGFGGNAFAATAFSAGPQPQTTQTDTLASGSLPSGMSLATNFPSGSGSGPSSNTGTKRRAPPSPPGAAAVAHATPTIGHGQVSGQSTPLGFGGIGFAATPFSAGPQPQPMQIDTPATGSLPSGMSPATNFLPGSGSGPTPTTRTKRRTSRGLRGAAAAAATPTIGHGQVSGHPTTPGFGGNAFAATAFSAGPQPQTTQTDTLASGSLPSGMSLATNFPSGSGSGPSSNTGTKRRAPPSPPGAAAVAHATPTIGHGQVSGQSTPLGFGGIGFAATPFSAGPQPQPMQIDTPATGSLPSGMSPATNFLPGSGSGPTPTTRTKRRTSRGLRGAAAAAATPTIGHGQVSGHPTTPGFGGNAFAATAFSAGPQPQTTQTDTLASGSLPSGMSLATNFPSGSGSGPSSNTGTKRRASQDLQGATSADAMPTIGHGQLSGQPTPPSFVRNDFAANPFSAGWQRQPTQTNTPASGSLPSSMVPANNFPSGSGSGPMPNTGTKRRASQDLQGATSADATPTIGHGQVSGPPTPPSFGGNGFAANPFSFGPNRQPTQTNIPASGSLPSSMLPANNFLSGSGSGPTPNTGTKRRASQDLQGATSADAMPTIGHGQVSGQPTPPSFGGNGFAANPFSFGPNRQPTQTNIPASGSLPSSMLPANNFLSGSGPTPNTGTKRRASQDLQGATSADATPTIGHGQVSGQPTPPSFGGNGFAANPFSAGRQRQPTQTNTPASGSLPSSMVPANNFPSGSGSGPMPNTGTKRRASQDLQGATSADATPTIGHGQVSGQPTPPSFGGNGFAANPFSAGRQRQPTQTNTPASGSLPSSMVPANNFPSGSGSGPMPNTGTERRSTPGFPGAASADTRSTIGQGQVFGQPTLLGFDGNGIAATLFSSGPQPPPTQTDTPASGSLPSGMPLATNFSSGSDSGPAPNTNTKWRASLDLRGADTDDATPTIGHGQVSGQRTPPSFGGNGFAATPFSAGPQPQDTQTDTRASGSLPSGTLPATHFPSGSGSQPAPNTGSDQGSAPSTPHGCPATDTAFRMPAIGVSQASIQPKPPGCTLNSSLTTIDSLILPMSNLSSH